MKSIKYLAACAVLTCCGVAFADPVAAVVTAPAVVEATSNVVTMIFAIGAGLGMLLAGAGVILHAWQAKSPGNATVATLAKDVDLFHEKLDELLAIGHAAAGSRTLIQEIAPTPAAVSPVTVNVHPTSAPQPAGTMTTTTVAPIAALLLFVGLAAGSVPGCAANTRADTLQTATLTVVVARDAVLAYDGPHELELAKAGTPDQATAALAAYRAKRAVVNKAIAVAADAIVLAGGLNDQVSLATVATAIAEVIADYKQLKGMP